MLILEVTLVDKAAPIRAVQPPEEQAELREAIWAKLVGDFQKQLGELCLVLLEARWDWLIDQCLGLICRDVIMQSVKQNNDYRVHFRIREMGRESEVKRWSTHII